MPYTDSGHIAPVASKVKITRADGSVVYQQPLGRTRKNISSTLQKEVYARDGLKCRYCGFKHKSALKFNIDHVIPVAKGGTEELSNLVVSCKKCNQAKGTKIWEVKVKPRWKEYKEANIGAMQKRRLRT